MASDLSSFLKNELANTLEQLLSKKVIIDSVNKSNAQELEDSQCIEVSIKFDFADISSTWKFFIPTNTATKFEYFMLGGMGDLKEHIDDEITDAVNEIIANVCGSLCTSVNAQGFTDISSIKSEVLGSFIKDCSELKSLENNYFFDLTLDGEKLPIYIVFDEQALAYLSGITREKETTTEATVPPINNNVTNANISSGSSSPLGISSLLSEESAENFTAII